MIRRALALIFILALTACSRHSVEGVYQTTGSVDKFRISLELRAGGAAALATRSNLGNPTLDQSVQSVMAISNGHWVAEKGVVLVQGVRGDGKNVTERFAIQENGDLVWALNGARFVRQP